MNVDSLILLLLILLSFSLKYIFAYNFQHILNKAKSTANSVYKNKFGNEKNMHFLGYDISEYPGTNEARRKTQADKWEEYYMCLRKQENNIGKYGSIIPEAMLALEGESIKMNCKVCISPLENNDAELIEWEWSHENGQYLEPIDYDEHTLLSPEDKVLHLYNVGTQHIGQYVCKLGKQLTAPYFLTVVNNSEPLQMVHPKSALKGQYAEPPWKISPQLILDTVWTKWSPCSTCGTVGKRHKYGHCIIILESNLKEMDIDNITTTNNNSNNEDIQIDDENILDENTKEETMINPSIKLSKLDVELLHIFKFGIPCRSHILPASFGRIKEIRERKSEIMIGYCKIKCAEEKIFVLKDKEGKVIESANNSAGIYSMAQGLPALEPPVERRLQFGSTDTHIIVNCPGNLNSDTPISWQIGGKNVVPSLLSQESDGRIYLSITDKIHIKKARTSDTNIYSCWQDKNLAGTVRLVVETSFKFDFNHHVLLFIIIVIFSTFIFIYVKAYLARKHVIGAI